MRGSESESKVNHWPQQTSAQQQLSVLEQLHIFVNTSHCSLPDPLSKAALRQPKLPLKVDVLELSLWLQSI